MGAPYVVAPPADYKSCGFPLPVDAKPFALPEKPYDFYGLEGMDEAYVRALYEESHAWYVDALNSAVPETTKTVEELASESTGAVSFYSAAVNSLNLFWQSVSPGAGGAPTGAIKDSITKSFGSTKGFWEDMTAAAEFYGAGWLYLVQNGESLQFVPLASAGNPGGKIILAVPVVSDSKNGASAVVSALEKNVNWEFANSRLDTKAKGVPVLGGMSKDAFVKGLKPSQKKQLDTLMAR